MNLLAWISPTHSACIAQNRISAQWLAAFFGLFLAGCAAPMLYPAPSLTAEPTGITLAATPALPTAIPAEPTPFQSLADFQQKLDGAVASGEIEPFWQTVVDTGQMPLVFGDTAVFLYRGVGQNVVWRGDFTLWDRAPAAAGIRQGQTDIWLMMQQFPLDARLDYKIVVDGAYLLDPLNPRTQLGGYGPNSVLYMPDYRYPEETLSHSDIAHGQLSEPLIIHSQALSYQVRYQVYTPADYENLKDLPVIYATDGQEYAHPEMGALPVVSVGPLPCAARARGMPTTQEMR